MKGLGGVSKSSKFASVIKQGKGTATVRMVESAAEAITRLKQLGATDEYWVYSTDVSSAVSDQRIEAKMNLEKLGYRGLRNENGELTSGLDFKFEQVRDKFSLDYGLTTSYASMQGNKEIQLFTWIRQAVKGQSNK